MNFACTYFRRKLNIYTDVGFLLSFGTGLPYLGCFKLLFLQVGDLTFWKSSIPHGSVQRPNDNRFVVYPCIVAVLNDGSTVETLEGDINDVIHSYREMSAAPVRPTCCPLPTSRIGYRFPAVSEVPCSTYIKYW